MQSCAHAKSVATLRESVGLRKIQPPAVVQGSPQAAVARVGSSTIAKQVQDSAVGWLQRGDSDVQLIRKKKKKPVGSHIATH